MALTPVLAKLEWFRHGGETSERQWTDVTGLLRAGVDIDRRYLSEGAGVVEERGIFVISDS